MSENDDDNSSSSNAPSSSSGFTVKDIILTSVGAFILLVIVLATVWYFAYRQQTPIQPEIPKENLNDTQLKFLDIIDNIKSEFNNFVSYANKIKNDYNSNNIDYNVYGENLTQAINDFINFLKNMYSTNINELNGSIFTKQISNGDKIDVTQYNNQLNIKMRDTADQILTIFKQINHENITGPSTYGEIEGLLTIISDKYSALSLNAPQVVNMPTKDYGRISPIY